MKKKYFVPEVEITLIKTEQGFLTDSFTGNSSANMTVVDSTNADDWVY